MSELPKDSKPQSPVSLTEAKRRARLWPFWMSISGVFLIGLAITATFVGALLLAIGRPDIQNDGPLARSDLIDLLRLALIGTAGIGGVIGLLIAYRRQRVAEVTLQLAEDAQHFDHALKHSAHILQERIAEAQRRDASATLITSLYTSAVEQLGSDRPALRLGALYSLERIGQNDPGSRQAVVDVLCAYLRLPFRPKETRAGRVEPRTKSELNLVYEETHVRMSVQHVLHQHLVPRGIDVRSQRLRTVDLPGIRRRVVGDFGTGILAADANRQGEFWDGMHLDLRFSNLVNLDLKGARVASANFAEANLYGYADFDGLHAGSDTSFFRTRFYGSAYFAHCQFAGNAYFYKARFKRYVSFEGCNFFNDVDFVDSSFSGICHMINVRFGGDAHFDGATFRRKASFDGANFEGSAEFGIAAFWLESAKRSGTQFREQATFDHARFGGRVSFMNTRFRTRPSFEDSTADEGKYYRRWPAGHMFGTDPLGSSSQ